MDNLGFLEWTPGIYLAAKELSEYLKTQTVISSIGPADATTQKRLLTYGTTGPFSVEILYSGDNTPRNAIARLLIDDLDAKKRSRAALLSRAMTQAAVSIQPNEKHTHIGSIILDNGYSSDEPYDQCRKKS